MVVVLCAAQIVLWTAVPALTVSAMPLDVLEGYVWGREWLIGTYKHPALPSWVLEASRLVLGTTGWPAFLISQLFVAATFAIVFLIGRDLMDDARGAAAVLLLTGVYYFSWPTHEFNHNVAQMPFWVGFVLALWRAVERNSLAWWLIAAVVAALGIYSKLSMATLLVVAAAWMLLDQRARAALATPGPYVSGLVFCLLSAPLARWLIVTDFQPLQHVGTRARSEALGNLWFLLLQAALYTVPLLMLATSGLLPVGRRGDQSTTAEQPKLDADAARSRRFVMIMAFGPFVLALGLAAIAGLRLRTPWATAFSTMAGLAAMALITQSVTHKALHRLGVWAAGLLLVVPALFAADVLIGIRQVKATHLQSFRQQRVNWPQHEIMRRLVAEWSKATGKSLRIVIGEIRVAGLVALDAPGAPSVMEFESERSPWVSPQRLAREGALVVWSEPGGIPVEWLIGTYGAGHPVHRVTFPWPRAPQAEPVTIGYIIRPPG